MKKHSIATLRFAMALGICAFMLGSMVKTCLIEVQFGPTVLSLASAITISAFIIVCCTFIGTVLFGRFFCAVLCPLGTMQDAMGALRYSRPSPPNLQWLRYGIAAVSFTLFIAGWNIGFSFFEPFTRADSIIASFRGGLAQPDALWQFLMGGALPLGVIFLLVSWKKRLYCIAICPIGTVLGLLARFSLLGVRFTEDCVACGKCIRGCPGRTHQKVAMPCFFRPNNP